MFTWHGGETLMRPLSFYKKAMELQKKYAGTLIGDYICFFMEKNRNTVEDKALYYGLQALLETRHSS